MKVMASAPGKLFLAGEYAVVEPGHQALVAAIDRYVTVHIEESDCGTIYSSQQDVSLFWERQAQEVLVADPEPYSLIVAAIRTVEEYVRSQGLKTTVAYHVVIDSDLDDQKSGRKYGLGSSGAVTVAMVRALLAFYGLARSTYLVFQLAVLSQMRIGLSGSFGDIAASSYGGVISYHSVDRQWLQTEIKKGNLVRLLSLSWRGLQIERLALPQNLSLLVGWTGQVALTKDLLSEASQQLKNEDKDKAYAHFLQESQACLTSLVEACRTEQVTDFIEGIARNRRLLKDLEGILGVQIETAALQALIELALKTGAAAKTSGAGGGDCGIAFVTDQDQVKVIQEAWETKGIVPLDCHIAEGIKE